VGEEVEERWGLVSRAAAGASPPRSDEYARSRTRRGAVRDRGGAGPEQRTVHRRERLLRHAIDVHDPASTTPPTRCERRGHPFPLCRFLALSLCVGVPSSRQWPSASRCRLPMGDAASRLAGGGLGPWLPQVASTQCSRQVWVRAVLLVWAEGHPAPRRRASRRTRVAPLVRRAGSSITPRRVSGRAAAVACAVVL
jgi:hypothetical protein